MVPKTKGSAAGATVKELQAPATSTYNGNGVLTNNDQAPGGQAVNKKKQKRRQKALRAASQQQQAPPTDNPPLNGHAPPTHPPSLPPSVQYEDPNFAADQYGEYDEEEAYSDEDGQYDYDPSYLPPNGLDMSNGTGNGTIKKKKPKHNATLDHVYARPPPLHPTTEAIRSINRPKYEKIWETNSNEERKRIKQFWLDLPEEKRRSLVNIEKRHVLDKMKEQQKHSCSCTVCGRKRTAIEEELEVLYDRFSTNFNCLLHMGTANERLRRLRDPRIWADPTNIANVSNPPLPPHQSSRSRITELADGEDEDGELEDEEDDEDYSEDEYDDYSDEIADGAPPGSADFFRFGSDLRIKDGILTVADDLLQNDGQKFIDMMEMLAEKRIRREQDALDAHAANGHTNHYPRQPGVLPHTHSHADQNLPPEEDEEYDDDEEEYSDDEYDDDEEDEMDTMTEEQRMQEGRRMFQIFAARMFEQRVVQAYKEKVAEERQQALIADEESKGNEGSSEAKRAKAAEKKKRQREKARELKAAKDAAKEEDRLRKEAAVREAEEKKKEDQRQKQEEARKRKEAEREALAEKKRRKDAEAQKRIEAERERQAEQERKVREQKAEEKRKRDEAERQKREEKEAREKELRERKAHADKQQQDKDTRDKTSKPKSKDEPVADPQPPHILKRPSVPAGVALPPSLKSKPSYSESPQIKVATPALPKAPTPAKPREASSQQVSSPHTPERTLQSKQSLSPRSNTSQTNLPSCLPALRTSGQPFVFNQSSTSQSTTMSPMRPIQPPPGMHHPGMGIGGLQSMGGFSGPQRPGNLWGSPVKTMPMHPQMYPQQRQYMPNAPPGMMPPGMQQHQTPQTGPGFGGAFGQQGPMTGHIGSAQPIGHARDMPPQSHSRQPSAQLDSTQAETPSSATAPAPISRPAPIKRPASVKPGQTTSADVDELSSHLGSSALLGDGDEPLPMGENRRPSAAPGMPTSASLSGMHKPFDHLSTPFSRGPSNDNWGRPPFGPPGIAGQPGWSQQSSGWGGYQSIPQPSRQVGSRAAKVRTYTVQSCRFLVNSNRSDDAGYMDYNEVIDRTQASARQLHLEPPVRPDEIENILDTLGDHNNGGGTFEMVKDNKGRQLIRWVDDRMGPHHAQPGAPGPRGLGLGGLGDIGSPRIQPLLPSLGSMREPRY